MQEAERMCRDWDDSVCLAWSLVYQHGLTRCTDIDHSLVGCPAIGKDGGGNYSEARKNVCSYWNKLNLFNFRGKFLKINKRPWMGPSDDVPLFNYSEVRSLDPAKTGWIKYNISLLQLWPSKTHPEKKIFKTMTFGIFSLMGSIWNGFPIKPAIPTTLGN